MLFKNVYIKGAMDEIGRDLDGLITLLMDSKNASYSANNLMHHKRINHIDIKYHWIKEKVGAEDAIVHL